MTQEKKAIIKSTLFLVCWIISIILSFLLSWKATLIMILAYRLMDHSVNILKKELEPLSPFDNINVDKTPKARRSSNRK